MASEGRHDDSGKTRLELISPIALEELGKVLTFGSKKYEDWNWAKGIDWSRIYGSVLRHLNAWWSLQDKDPESGLSHLAHALCNLTFLVTYEATGVGRDDRWRPGRNIDDGWDPGVPLPAEPLGAERRVTEEEKERLRHLVFDDGRPMDPVSEYDRQK